MTIAVRGKNIEVTPALKDYVTKRVSKVTKYFDQIGEMTAVLKVEKGRHIVELTVPINGMILRGEEATADMYASIDQVVEKIEKQIEKYKTKLAKRIKSGSFKSELVTGSLTEEEESDSIKVVKTKRFSVRPMFVEEAVLQMNMINHDFFVFRNAETEEVNVVYRRKDGQYGLIESEF